MKKNKRNRQETWKNLVGKLADLPQRLTEAIDEGMQEAIAETLNLSCVRNGVLDFDLIEDDIIRIQRNLESKGDRILGSHLILDDQQDLFEIQTYTKKGEKTYRTVNSAKVEKIINVPQDIKEELNENKRVELSFTLD